MIPSPLFPTNFSFVDPDCKFLAERIYCDLNTTFQLALGGNIVRTLRTFNDNFIPLQEFPILKVYKDAEEELDLNSDILSTKFIISYALAFVQAPKIGDVSTFVSKEIRRILKNLSETDRIQIDWNSGLSIDYEDFIDPKNVVYKYTTIRVFIFTSPSSLC
jgi:hypothetical protein